MLTVSQLEESCGIYNPSEQLAYYWLRAETEAEQKFADLQIIALKRNYLRYCVNHRISTAEAWEEIELAAQALVNKFTKAMSVIAG